MKWVKFNENWYKANNALKRRASFISNSDDLAIAMTNTNDDPKPDARVDPKLLEILVCPLTKTVLEYDENAQELISREAGLAYPIRDGIPIMLPDEARKIDENDKG